MALPGNGIFVVQGEMSTVITAMKRSSRWSSTSHNDEQDSLLKSFQRLREIINNVEDLRMLDPLTFLDPFLQVIRSEDTTGPVTSLALAAVNKFLSYGIIDPTHSSAPACVDSIADAVTHARFVGTDQASDGVVLMEILQVLRTLMLSPEGAMLTNETVCEIMLSCFRICFEPRLTELLRRTAKHCLRDMVQLLFMRLPQFAEDLRQSFNLKKLKMRASGSEQSHGKRRSKNVHHKNHSSEPSQANDNEVGHHTPVLNRPNHGNNLKPQPLSTTPMTPAGNIVDLQGSISRTPCSQTSSNADFTSTDDNSVDQSSIVISVDSPSMCDDANVSNEEKDEETCDKTPCNEIADKLENIEENVESSLENLAIDNIDNPEGLSEEYVNRQGVRFTPHSNEPIVPVLPYGLPCIRELFRFLISLCNPLDKQNTELMTHTGLSLLTVVFEVSADNIGKYSALLSLVKDELCRNLFGLLNSERLSIFAADLQVCFLLFESTRCHLKYQLEFYLKKLTDIIVSESPKVAYEQKEISLEAIVQLWHIPGLVTELYLNYDCDMYSSDLFENLTKLLSKNAFPITSGVYKTHLLSLDALLTIVRAIESNCNTSKISRKVVFNDESPMEDISSFINAEKNGRQKVIHEAPGIEDLNAVKNKKRFLATGTELFNSKPEKGIQFLQEHNILSANLDPLEIAHFLRENPQLDKKMIGEYISKKKNVESRILEVFVKSFDFAEMRIDEALRIYLETFRLPGEAPLIFLVMEHFAEHWHQCNGEPFANTDAAFRLAYAIIMLNMDQHNHNAKRLNVPMTAEDFMKNLRGLNGNADFDQDMLLAVYTSIKNEEIVMPAEQVGLVRENYLWKVLLRRGASNDGLFHHVPHNSYDKELFSLIWGPAISALSFVYDKSQDSGIHQKAIEGFEQCANIIAHYNLTTNFDTLILTLCKFTTLMSISTSESDDSNQLLNVSFGRSAKGQLATRTVFRLVHNHGDLLREGWKYIFDMVLRLYKSGLLPKVLTEADDFCEPSGKISLIAREIAPAPKMDTGLLSSLYSYIALSSETANQRILTHEEQELSDQAKNCIAECGLEQLIIDSKFLQNEALHELINSLILISKPPDGHKSLGMSYNEDATVFFLELLVKVFIQNRDRIGTLWSYARDHLYLLVTGASSCDYIYLLTRAVTSLLRLAICLMRNEEMAPVVMDSLKMLLLLKPTLLFKISKHISTGLFELLKTSAQNIHTETDWSIIFTLLECVGAGAIPPKISAPDDNRSLERDAKSDGAVSSEDDCCVHERRGYTSDSELTMKQSLETRKHATRQSGDNWIMINNKDQTIESVNQVQSNMEMQTGSPVKTNDKGQTIESVNQVSVTNAPEVVITNNEVPGQTIETLNHGQSCKEIGVRLLPHSPEALVKCWECLAFIVRDVAHITPYNFQSCIRCIRIFVEATLHGSIRKKKFKSKKSKSTRRRGNNTNEDGSDSDPDDLPEGYRFIAIQLLDLMHTLHTRTAQIFRWWAEEAAAETPTMSLWTNGWRPLLQGIARLCCDNRMQVRSSAINYLHRALLMHDLQTLTPAEWENCFLAVLFPLLGELLGPTRQINSNNSDIEEPLIYNEEESRSYSEKSKNYNEKSRLIDEKKSRINLIEKSRIYKEESLIRVSTIMSKVFLHHLSPLLTLDSFTNLWLAVLDFIERFMKTGSDLLREAILESLKNMLLVMHSVEVFTSPQGYTNLWTITWERIDTFLPDLKDEIFKEDILLKKIDKVRNKQENPNMISNTTHQVGIDTDSLNQIEVPGNDYDSTKDNIQNQTETNFKREIEENPNMLPNITQVDIHTVNQIEVLEKDIQIQNQNQNPVSIISSPLFTHLGQMVSTPIGIPNQYNGSSNNSQCPPSYSFTEIPQKNQTIDDNLNCDNNSSPYTGVPIQYNNSSASQYSKMDSFTETLQKKQTNDSTVDDNLNCDNNSSTYTGVPMQYNNSYINQDAKLYSFTENPQISMSTDIPQTLGQTVSMSNVALPFCNYRDAKLNYPDDDIIPNVSANTGIAPQEHIPMANSPNELKNYLLNLTGTNNIYTNNAIVICNTDKTNKSHMGIENQMSTHGINIDNLNCNSTDNSSNRSTIMNSGQNIFQSSNYFTQGFEMPPGTEFFYSANDDRN